jgi:hypothetical protein
MAHGAQQARNAAIGSTTDQMNTEAARAVMRALWLGTVACRELHCFLLIRTVCHVSGVYSECSRPPFVFIHAIEGQHPLHHPSKVFRQPLHRVSCRERSLSQGGRKGRLLEYIRISTADGAQILALQRDTFLQSLQKRRLRGSKFFFREDALFVQCGQPLNRGEDILLDMLSLGRLRRR